MYNANHIFWLYIGIFAAVIFEVTVFFVQRIHYSHCNESTGRKTNKCSVSNLISSLNTLDTLILDEIP